MEVAPLSVRRVERRAFVHPHILHGAGGLLWVVLLAAPASRCVQTSIPEAVAAEGLCGQVVPGLGLHLVVLDVLRLLRLSLPFALLAQLTRGVLSGTFPVKSVGAQRRGVAVGAAFPYSGRHRVADLTGGARVEAALAHQPGSDMEISPGDRTVALRRHHWAVLSRLGVRAGPGNLRRLGFNFPDQALLSWTLVFGPGRSSGFWICAAPGHNVDRNMDWPSRTPQDWCCRLKIPNKSTVRMDFGLYTSLTIVGVHSDAWTA
ncbi:hypothetical protein HUJ05_005130 [Dendroctonus ponderosae]|nr:hypothetical protein HUJ05_005130 [Dendroctonus ponderosae]